MPPLSLSSSPTLSLSLSLSRFAHHLPILFLPLYLPLAPSLSRLASFFNFIVFFLPSAFRNPIRVSFFSFFNSLASFSRNERLSRPIFSISLFIPLPFVSSRLLYKYYLLCLFLPLPVLLLASSTFSFSPTSAIKARSQRASPRYSNVASVVYEPLRKLRVRSFCSPWKLCQPGNAALNNGFFFTEYTPATNTLPRGNYSLLFANRESLLPHVYPLNLTDSRDRLEARRASIAN